MSSGWGKGSTRAWRKIRLAVLQRDGWQCRLQIPGICTGNATHAHHLYGRSQTGDNMEFIVASCQACNLHTGDPQRPRRRTPARPAPASTYDRW